MLIYKSKIFSRLDDWFDSWWYHIKTRENYENPLKYRLFQRIFCIRKYGTKSSLNSDDCLAEKRLQS